MAPANRFAKYIVQPEQDQGGGTAPAPAKKPNRFAKYVTPEAPPASMAPAAKAPPMQPSNGAGRIPISPLKHSAQSRGPTGLEGYQGNQFPTNWPKGMAAPPKAPEGYDWQDTGYSYDLKQNDTTPKDYVSMAPAQLRQMRADQAAAAERSAAQRESDAAFGMMDGLPLRVQDDGTSAPEPERDLGVRATVNALNTMGPGTVNSSLDMAEAAASASPGNAAMRAYAEAKNRQEPSRITFGAENAAQPQQDMRFRVPEIPLEDPQNTAEQFADIGGDLAGYLIGPGKGVEAGLKATGVTEALMKFAPKGNSTAAKLGRYGARILNPIDDVAHAAAFGMATGEDGQRFETAAQYATDPINYLGRPIASLIQRGGIALSTLGKRVTPEAIQLEQALSVLQSGKATPAQMQAAAQVIDRYAPADDSIIQPAPAASQPPPVQPQAAAQAAQPPAPVQTATSPPVPPQPPVGGPPVAAGAAGNPPGVPVAQAAQTPPPGTLTPVGLGPAEQAVNAMPRKSREALWRAFQNSGMNRQQAEQAIRSLNDLPPGQNSMYEFELIRRFGQQFPRLKANLQAMGRDWAITIPKDPRKGSPNQVMDDNVGTQIKSEGEFIDSTAQSLFGQPATDALAGLETTRRDLSGRYNTLLDPANPYGPNVNRMRGANKAAHIQKINAALEDLTQYLQRPEIMAEVPEWVRSRVMLDIAKDMRERGGGFLRLLEQNSPEVARLVAEGRPLRYTPELWQTLTTLYPTQVGHTLQSAYGRAIREGLSSGDVVARTAAEELIRLRGGSKVRANALNPDKRGFGLLHYIEEAVPGYRDVRKQYGDIMGAEEAVYLPESFFRIANNDVALDEWIKAKNDLSPAQQAALESGMTTQIQQALRKKHEMLSPEELDQVDALSTPNLTRLSEQPVLNALEKAFGAKGKQMADAIRAASTRTDRVRSIHPNYGPRTAPNQEAVKNAGNIYGDPLGSERNVIDNMAGTLAGAGAASALNPMTAAAAPILLTASAARGLYNLWKRGKRLNGQETEQLADFFFRSRRPDIAEQIRGPRGPSVGDYAGAVARDAAIGAGVGAGAASATGQDPMQGAVAGGIGGAAFGARRAGVRNARSLIKPPPAGGPRGGNRLRTGGNPPPAIGPRGTPRIPPGDAGFAGVTPLGVLAGGAGGALAGAAMDKENPGRGAVIGALGVGGVAYGAGRALTRSRPAGNALKSGGKPPPAANNVEAGPWKPAPPRTPELTAKQRKRARQQELRDLGLSGKQARRMDASSPDSVMERGQAAKDFQLGVEVATLRGKGVPDAEVAQQLGVRGGTEELDRLEELVGAYDWGHPAIRPEFYAGTSDALKPLDIMELRQQQAKRQTVTPFRKAGPTASPNALKSGSLKPPAMAEAGPKAPPASPTVKPSGAPKPPPVQATGNRLKAPPTGKSRIPGEIGRRLATGAATWTALTAANAADAQEDLSPKIGFAEQQISDLRQKLADFDNIKDPRAKQRFLKDAGYYAGAIDGNIAGKTTEGMERWTAKIEADMAEYEADLVDLRRRDALQRNEPNPYVTALRDVGPNVAAIAVILGMKPFRASAAKKSVATAKKVAKGFDRYVTKGPVTSYVNKAGQSRPANLNTFWKAGGAKDNELPFLQDPKGGWKPNPNAKAADELFSDNGYWKAITRYVSGKDLAFILGGTVDAVGAQFMIDVSNEKLRRAEALWNEKPSDETARLVEDARNEVAMYTLVQRLGAGVAAGRVLGSFGNAYARPRPKLEAAATEQAAIKEYIAGKKPPPKPRAPKVSPPTQLPPVGGTPNGGNP